MDKNLRFGNLIATNWLLSLFHQMGMQCKLTTKETPTKWLSWTIQAQKECGGETLSTLTNNSSILRTEKLLIQLQVKTKALKSKSQLEMIQLNKSSTLYILTTKKMLLQVVSMRNLVSTSTDHFTSDQDFQWKELLNATVPTMFGWEDGERMSLPNNGTLMESPRHWRTTTGNLTLLIFKGMVVQTI